MTHEPLTLELGPGFVSDQVESADEHVAFATSRTASPQIEVVVAPPGLGTRRVLGRLPGNSLPAGTIVGGRLRKKLYVAGEEGIWEFPLEGGAPSLVVGLPDLPAASKADVQEAYGANAHNENWVQRKEGLAHYFWVLVLDEAEDRLFALAGQKGTLDHFVEINLDSRAITSTARMPGFCAGIQVDLRRRRIVLPALRGGPQILDFAGHQLARWSDGKAHPSGRFWDAAVRPADGAVILADHEGGLWLWDWPRDRQSQIADHAAAPSCSSGGAVFFMRASAELWMAKEDAAPALIVRALGTELDRERRWVMRPRLSADGRFLLAQLTAIRETKTAEVPVHDAVVVDLAARRVQHVPGFFEHTLAWF